VVYTHAHADHVHGLDDLRMIVFNMRARLPVWADGRDPRRTTLLSRFGYAFTQPEGSPYPPILDMHTIDGDVTIEGPAGRSRLHPVRGGHGRIDALGFRIGGSPICRMSPRSPTRLAGAGGARLLDPRRAAPHAAPDPCASGAGARLDRARRPARAVLTNMHIDLDYATVEAETPATSPRPMTAW
jgi:phosphoribosyl 1,2-cyclic phosphate phosphodiesterase